MATDGSLGTLTEEWLIAAIAGIAGIGATNVDFFRGIENQEKPIDFVLEMLRERPVYAAVSWTGRTAVPDTERNQDFNTTHSIFLGVRNERVDAAARVGDGTYKGANWYLEQFLKVIEMTYDHAGAPIQTADMHVDTIRVTRQEALFWPTGASITKTDVTVQESRRP